MEEIQTKKYIKIRKRLECINLLISDCSDELNNFLEYESNQKLYGKLGTIML